MKLLLRSILLFLVVASAASKEKSLHGSEEVQIVHLSNNIASHNRTPAMPALQNNGGTPNVTTILDMYGPNFNRRLEFDDFEKLKFFGKSCPPYMGVSKADCRAAGLSVGGRLRNGRLVEGSWYHVSFGCSVQSDGVIHYNSKSNVQNDGGFTPVCKRGSHESHDYATLSISFASCPSFMHVHKSDCLIAGLSVGGRLRNGKLVIGSWHHVSFGCSVDGNGDIHYNTKRDARNTGGFIPVCKTASTFPSSSKSCWHHLDVSKADCAAAGLSVGGRLRYGRLVVGSWRQLSRGCSLQHDGDIHYNTKSGAQNTYGFVPVCKTAASVAPCYFCDKYISTMFILMTHNSYAFPNKVSSPNQNYGVGKQFRDGIRGFNFDIYWRNGKIVMKHGTWDYTVDYSRSVAAIVTEMRKPQFIREFVLVQFEDYVGEEGIDKVLRPWGDWVITNFDSKKKLGDYILSGKRVLLTSKYRREGKGIHWYGDHITENNYGCGSALKNIDFGYRRGPKDSHHSAKMMNHFCTGLGGSMVASAIVNKKSRMLYDARIFKKQSYAKDTINIIMVDYYDTGDVFGAQRSIRSGDFNSGCWSDGSLCGIGSTCFNCCNQHGYWYGKAMTACGQEPCWGAGRACGRGTTCNACCNGSSWKWKHVVIYFTYCN